MLAFYWGPALRPGVVDGTERCLIVGFGDATGGWCNEPVTHFEIGIGSWAQGRSTSKITLLSAHVCEGKDDALTLRSRCS
eukprot:4060661-Pleurochrysis_carterae.AAC.1